MNGMVYVQSSNNWGGSSLRGSMKFARRYPWTVAFVILFVAMIVGFGRVQQLTDAQNEDRADRREENLTRDKQFCRAIPSTGVAAAQALVNILISDARGDNERITRLRWLGSLYTQETRRLALLELPECPKILVTKTP